MGVTILGYPEKEVWHMTLRKLMCLFDAHKFFMGIKEPKVTSLDDIF